MIKTVISERYAEEFFEELRQKSTKCPEKCHTDRAFKDRIFEDILIVYSRPQYKSVDWDDINSTDLGGSDFIDNKAFIEKCVKIAPKKIKVTRENICKQVRDDDCYNIPDEILDKFDWEA